MSHNRARIPRPVPERPIEVPQAVSGRQTGEGEPDVASGSWLKSSPTPPARRPGGRGAGHETRRQSCRMPLSLPGGAAAVEPLGRQPGLRPRPGTCLPCSGWSSAGGIA